VKNALLAMPLLVAGVAVTAGCAASPAAPSSITSSGTASSGSAAVSATVPGGASAAASAGPAVAVGTDTSASGAPACTSADLKASLGGGAGPGMSQNHTGLQLQNTGSSACTLYGYPGVSWVAGADGQQVGPGAARQADPAGGPEKTVTLAPGALASAPLDIVDAAAISASECKPVAVRGLRVYPPGEKAAVFIPRSSAGGYGECSKPTSQPTLMIGYMQSGPQPGNGGQG
jgi:hypothetical protein